MVYMNQVYIFSFFILLVVFSHAVETETTLAMGLYNLTKKNGFLLDRYLSTVYDPVLIDVLGRYLKYSIPLCGGVDFTVAYDFKNVFKIIEAFDGKRYEATVGQGFASGNYNLMGEYFGLGFFYGEQTFQVNKVAPRKLPEGLSNASAMSDAYLRFRYKVGIFSFYFPFPYVSMMYGTAGLLGTEANYYVLGESLDKDTGAYYYSLTPKTLSSSTSWFASLAAEDYASGRIKFYNNAVENVAVQLNPLKILRLETILKRYEQIFGFSFQDSVAMIEAIDTIQRINMQNMELKTMPIFYFMKTPTYDFYFSSLQGMSVGSLVEYRRGSGELTFDIHGEVVDRWSVGIALMGFTGGFSYYKNSLSQVDGIRAGTWGGKFSARVRIYQCYEGHHLTQHFKRFFFFSELLGDGSFDESFTKIS